MYLNRRVFVMVNKSHRRVRLFLQKYPVTSGWGGVGWGGVGGNFKGKHCSQQEHIDSSF